MPLSRLTLANSTMRMAFWPRGDQEDQPDLGEDVQVEPPQPLGGQRPEDAERHARSTAKGTAQLS